MPDRKGRMTLDDIRNAGKLAIRRSKGMPSKRVIERAMQTIRAFDNGGMTAIETENAPMGQFQPDTSINYDEMIRALEGNAEKNSLDTPNRSGNDGGIHICSRPGR